MFLTLVFRFWHAFSGVVTLFLLVRRLDPEVLGYYYSFLAISAIFSVLDFGSLTVFKIWIAEKVKLRLYKKKFIKIAYDTETSEILSNLTSTLLITGTSLLFIIIVVVSFLSSFLELTADSSLILIILMSASFFNFVLTPYFTLLEGAGLVSLSSLIRLVSSLFGSLLVWVFIIYSPGLYIVFIQQTTLLIVTIIFFFFIFDKGEQISVISFSGMKSWLCRFFKYQMGLGLIDLGNYLRVQFMIPIVLLLDGPDFAGVLGVSFTALNMVSIISQVPFFSEFKLISDHVNNKNENSRIRLFLKSYVKVFFIYAFFLLIINLILYGNLASIIGFLENLRARFPSLIQFNILAIAYAFNIMTGGLVVFCRMIRFNFNSFYIFLLSIINMIISSVSILYFGILGFAVSFCIVNFVTILFVLPYPYLNNNYVNSRV